MYHLSSDLVAALPGLDVDDFSHVSGCFEDVWETRSFRSTIGRSSAVDNRCSTLPVTRTTVSLTSQMSIRRCGRAHRDGTTLSTGSLSTGGMRPY